MPLPRAALDIARGVPSALLGSRTDLLVVAGRRASRIDPRTGRVTARAPVLAAATPLGHEPAVALAGLLWAASAPTRTGVVTLRGYAPATLSLRRTYRVGGFRGRAPVVSLATDPAGQVAWLAAGHSIVALSLATGQVRQHLTAGPGELLALAVSPDGRWLFDAVSRPGYTADDGNSVLQTRRIPSGAVTAEVGGSPAPGHDAVLVGAVQQILATPAGIWVEGAAGSRSFQAATLLSHRLRPRPFAAAAASTGGPDAVVISTTPNRAWIGGGSTGTACYTARTARLVAHDRDHSYADVTLAGRRLYAIDIIGNDKRLVEINSPGGC